MKKMKKVLAGMLAGVMLVLGTVLAGSDVMLSNDYAVDNWHHHYCDEKEHDFDCHTAYGEYGYAGDKTFLFEHLQEAGYSVAISFSEPHAAPSIYIITPDGRQINIESEYISQELVAFALYASSDIIDFYLAKDYLICSEEDSSERGNWAKCCGALTFRITGSADNISGTHLSFWLIIPSRCTFTFTRTWYEVICRFFGVREWRYFDSNFRHEPWC